ncbi:dihydroorotase [Candidatus Methylopumilus turicensis]|uniref:Dihydroorotase n=1 Tax=Candidatus Methylopumilus turicensis TaxID=1581680 RepID=A0A0B7IW97_9PROT|nr:dihydroorotase [Candidatus Methylopumilus turicensis]CEN56582.1 dihydro-orotase [Candidatus Methylopumilus turicensis]
MHKITITRPDDWHLHLRDGEALKAVLPDTAHRFARAIVMPNLRPPVTTIALAAEYRQRILDALPTATVRTEPVEGDDLSTLRQAQCERSGELNFEPLMTLYLTDNTSIKDVEEAKASGFVKAFKLYPAGATTNSDSGVTSLDKCAAALSAMEKLGMPLLVHAEVTDADVDVFDREKVFIDRHMKPLLVKYPALKVVFEHITTKDAAEFVASAPANVAATITPHHLLMNRNAMFTGGIRPHHYCLPILKREEHRVALVKVATSGSPKFFLGTDSAPHAKSAKESACGCAGMYSAHAGIELYAEVFETANALHKLEGFASFYGADFYGLPRNTDQITLVKEVWSVPAEIAFADEVLVPLRAGQTVAWKIV